MSPIVSYSPVQGKQGEFYSGDAHTEEGVHTPYHKSLAMLLGRENKSTDVFDVYLAYDTEIPAGATINKAALGILDSGTNTEAASVNVNGLAPGKWDATRTENTSDLATLEVTLYDGVNPKSTTVFNPSLGVPIRLSAFTGITSAGQVILTNSSGTLTSLKIKIGRASPYAQSSEIGIVYFEIWSVTGTAGAYTPLSRLAVSDNMAYASLTSASTPQEEFTFSGPNQISITDETNYIAKLIIDGVDPDTPFAFVTLDVAVPFNSPSDQNILYFGEFDAFTPYLYPTLGAFDAQAVLSTSTQFTLADTASEAGGRKFWGEVPFWVAPHAGSNTEAEHATSTSLVLTASSTTVNILLPGSLPAGIAAGDHIYLEYPGPSYQTNSNFSTEDLHHKWWKVLGFNTTYTLHSIEIEWDQTFSGSTHQMVADAAKFWTAQPASTAETTAIKVAVQECVNDAGYTGRVGLRLATDLATSVENSVHNYWSEDGGGYSRRGAFLDVDYTDPTPPAGISFVDAAASLGPRVSGEVSLSQRVESKSTLTSSVESSITVN